MTEQLRSTDYYDLVEDIGHDHLAQLERARRNPPDYILAGNIQAYSHDITYPDTIFGALTHLTTYRTGVYPHIDAAILKHPQPPRYLHTIVAALTGALIDHSNNTYTAKNAHMKPDPEALQDQLGMIWMSFQQPNTALEDEATIYQTANPHPISLNLVRRGGRLALDYVSEQKYARLRF